MTAAAAIQLALQIIALYPTVEPAVVQAIKDLKSLFEGGAQPTQADIDALIARVEAQSAQIQAIEE